MPISEKGPIGLSVGQKLITILESYLRNALSNIRSVETQVPCVRLDSTFSGPRFDIGIPCPQDSVLMSAIPTRRKEIMAFALCPENPHY